jgi:hypothetical protein
MQVWTNSNKIKMKKEDNNVKEWGFALAWNKALEQIEERPMQPRGHLWASELGKSPVDLWLKLRGTPLTNPPNARSLRKFEAGNVFEWIVSLVLKRAGILKEQQKWSSWQYPGMVEVTGKADFIAGGIAKKDVAIEAIGELGLPNVFIKGGTQILEYLEELGALEEMPLEVKSVSSFMFESLEKNKSASKIHRLQLTHYLKAMGYEKGRIVYICRDDLRMMEFVVYLETAEPEYKKFIEDMTAVLKSDVRPEVENKIIFDNDLGKFAKNFNVAYSGYLTMLYGFKDQKEFDEMHTPVVNRWNRVMGRIKNGDKMTPKNLEVIAEMKLAGFNPDELVSKFVGTATEEEAA